MRHRHDLLRRPQCRPWGFIELDITRFRRCYSTSIEADLVSRYRPLVTDSNWSNTGAQMVEIAATYWTVGLLRLMSGIGQAI